MIRAWSMSSRLPWRLGLLWRRFRQRCALGAVAPRQGLRPRRCVWPPTSRRPAWRLRLRAERWRPCWLRFRQIWVQMVRWTPPPKTVLPPQTARRIVCLFYRVVPCRI